MEGVGPATAAALRQGYDGEGNFHAENMPLWEGIIGKTWENRAKAHLGSKWESITLIPGGLCIRCWGEKFSVKGWESFSFTITDNDTSFWEKETNCLVIGPYYADHGYLDGKPYEYLSPEEFSRVYPEIVSPGWHPSIEDMVKASLEGTLKPPC
jgi:hypothetical protein